MKQHETAWLRKTIFLTMAILTPVSSVSRVRPAFAQVTHVNIDAVDNYINSMSHNVR